MNDTSNEEFCPKCNSKLIKGIDSQTNQPTTICVYCQQSIDNIRASSLGAENNAEQFKKLMDSPEKSLVRFQILNHLHNTYCGPNSNHDLRSFKILDFYGGGLMTDLYHNTLSNKINVNIFTIDNNKIFWDELKHKYKNIDNVTPITDDLSSFSLTFSKKMYFNMFWFDSCKSLSKNVLDDLIAVFSSKILALDGIFYITVFSGREKNYDISDSLMSLDVFRECHVVSDLVILSSKFNYNLKMFYHAYYKNENNKPFHVFGFKFKYDNNTQSYRILSSNILRLKNLSLQDKSFIPGINFKCAHISANEGFNASINKINIYTMSLLNNFLRYNNYNFLYEYCHGTLKKISLTHMNLRKPASEYRDTSYLKSRKHYIEVSTRRYLKNKEKNTSYRKQYRERNKEKEKQYRKQYHKDNEEKEKQYQKQYREKMKIHANAQNNLHLKNNSAIIL